MDLPGYRVSQALNSSLSNSQSIAFAGDIVQNSLLHTASSLFASGVGKELKKTLLVQMRVLSAQLVSVGKDPKIHHDFVWLWKVQKGSKTISLSATFFFFFFLLLFKYSYLHLHLTTPPWPNHPHLPPLILYPSTLYMCTLYMFPDPSLFSSITPSPIPSGCSCSSRGSSKWGERCLRMGKLAQLFLPIHLASSLFWSLLVLPLQSGIPFLPLLSAALRSSTVLAWSLS